MEYLTKAEIVKVIKQRFKEKIEWYFTQPGYTRGRKHFLCVLVRSRRDKFLTVCTFETQPPNSSIIVGVDAQLPDDEPDTGLIAQKVDLSWHLLSDLNRSDYNRDLQS